MHWYFFVYKSSLKYINGLVSDLFKLHIDIIVEIKFGTAAKMLEFFDIDEHLVHFSP